jgi:hypothetical protein
MTSVKHAVLTTSLILAFIAMAGPHPAFAQSQTRTQQETQTQERIYGSQLMTPQERAAYRNQLHNARTEQERERIRAEHHQAMQERARARGVTLPDMPPVPGGPGPGFGPGGGFGPGSGAGGGRGR